MKAARRLNRACGMLAFSVLADSALEHYRGGFHNKAMYAPLAASSLSLAASLHGGGDPRYGAHGGRHAIYALSALTGLAGLGFHTWNIGKRPGGFSWLNLFYAAPIGAPAALILCGTLGFSAERVRNNRPGTVPRLFDLPAGRTLALMSSLGLLGTVGEAGLLHFRGAYHNPVMFLPVTVPPLTAMLLANTAVGRARRNRRLTRWALKATAALGALRRRVPRLWRPAQHGRLVQLAADSAERPSPARSAKLYGFGSGRACRTGTAGGSSRCLTTSFQVRLRALSRLQCPGETQHAILERTDPAGHRPASRHAARTAFPQRTRMADA